MFEPFGEEAVGQTRFLIWKFTVVRMFGDLRKLRRDKHGQRVK